MRRVRLTWILSFVLAAALSCFQMPLTAIAAETVEACEPADPAESVEAEFLTEVVTDDAELGGGPLDSVGYFGYPDDTDTVDTTEIPQVEDAAVGTEDASSTAAESEGAVDSTAVAEPALAVEPTDAESASTNDTSETGATATTQETRIELDSGAQRGKDFISVDETFTTSDGTFELVMGGLKEENRRTLLAALATYFSADAQTPLTFVDEAFPDAEKYDVTPPVSRLTGEGFYDSMHCWAASASNILWVSGWAPRLVNPLTGSPFSSEDDVFEYFNASFSDAGSETASGIDWFFMGEYFLLSYGGDARLLKVNNPDDGLMKDFVSTLVQEGITLAEPSSGHPELIDELLRLGPSAERPVVFEAGIGPLTMGVVKASSHSVTIAGIIVDPSAKELADRFKAIGIIDSDNDGVPSTAMGKGSPTYGYGPSVEVKNADKEVRPNTVTFYGLKLIEDAEGTPCWEIVDYAMGADDPEHSDPWILYKLDALPFYSEQLIGLYSENRRGGGTAAVAEHVDLVVETVYTTDETDPIVNLYGFVKREHAVTEFVQGTPITLNFLVQNRSNVTLNEEYAGKGWFTADWKVVREADGTVVAQGQTVCELPTH